MNQQTEIDKLADQLREIYKTNDGPRLIAEVMREFPNPRRRWNEPGGRVGSDLTGGWGEPATSAPRL